MNSFLLAFQFLTIIPIKIKNIEEKNIPESLVYFPFVGLILGIILWSAANILSILEFSPLAINIIVVILLIILSGGIHLDGLADTADAFLSRKNKEEMLNIMRDSHIGVMGVLSLISILLLKIAFLSSISLPLKNISLLLMCVISRWSPVLSMFYSAYAREEGKAKVFIEGMNRKIFLFSLLIAILCVTAIWGLRGLYIFLIASALIFLVNKFIERQIGGITGDTLGAVSELTEVMVLIVVCILRK